MVLLDFPHWNTTVATYLYLSKDTPLATNATAVFVLEDHAAPITKDVNTLWATRDPSKDTATHYHVHTIEHGYTGSTGGGL